MDQPTNSQNVQLPPPTTTGTAEATLPSQMQMQTSTQTQVPVQMQQMAEAMAQVKRNENRRKMTRRVLLGAAGVGVCAGAVVATPFIAEKIGYYTQQQLDQALQDGIAQGRAQLLAELQKLEGIGLDAAILIADLTEFGAVNIVKPLADLGSTVGADVLGALAVDVEQAQADLAHANIHVGVLDNIAKLLSEWQANVSQDKLGQYAVQDATKADTYLKALQKKINDDSASSK